MKTKKWAKSSMIVVRVTEEEKTKLVEMACQHYSSLSDLIRLIIKNAVGSK